jgi:hypothetical protein
MVHTSQGDWLGNPDGKGISRDPPTVLRIAVGPWFLATGVRWRWIHSLYAPVGDVDGRRGWHGLALG